MEVIEKLHDINLRVAGILQQQQQLKTQAQNWENLYKEATEVQKKLIEQSTQNAKQNEVLNHSIAKIKSELSEWQQKHQDLLTKQNSANAENNTLKTRLNNLTQELQTLRKKEEQQISLHFGAEKEQEKLKALSEDLKEQLQASQQLNHELQTELQSAKITLVEEQSAANTVLQQRNNLSNELAQLKEKYQNEISELHSKNSQIENQTEKLNAETRKLQEALNELTQSHSEKQETTEQLRNQLLEMEAQLHSTPTPGNEAYLNSQIEQLTAQIHNLEFEKELWKKNRNFHPLPQPVKMAEVMSQKPAGNEEHVHFLYAELQASQNTNAELEKRMNNYIEIIAELNNNKNLELESLKNIEEQNKIVKLAQAIEGNTGASNLERKQLLNEMIKEVDRCIAKLSSYIKI